MPRKNSAAALKIENEKLKAQIAAMNELSTGAPPSVESPLIMEVETRSRLSGTVTVACKVEMGLQLQLQKKQSILNPTGHGGGHNAYERVEQNIRYGKIWHVFGPAMPASGGRPDGYLLPQRLEGGYALTRGIPAAFWAEWLEQNKLAPYVVNGMIFAMEDDSVVAKARELGELTSGMEPLSRELDASGRLKDRRVPKPMTGSISRIAYDADRDAERGNKQNA